MSKVSHVGHLLSDLGPIFGKFFHEPWPVFGKLFHHLEPALDKVHGGAPEVLLFILLAAGLLVMVALAAVVVAAAIALGIQWVSSFAMMILGTIKASKDSKRNSTAKISAGNIKMSYKGSPWLIVAIVGALLLVFHSINQFMHHSPLPT
jgi:hypothetical protein